MLHIVFLGTGGAGGFPGRAQNCILVESRATRTLLDAGPGCGSRLLEAGYKVCDIDYVYISHVHLDHWAGLFDLAVQAAAEKCRLPRLIAHHAVRGPLWDRLQASMPRSILPQLEVREAGSEPLALGDLSIRLIESSHSIPCYGAAVSSGGSVFYYSSDTSLTSTVVEVARKADIAALEATFPPGEDEAARLTGHMTVSDVAGIAAETGSLIVAVHLTPRSLQAARRSELSGRVVFASDLMELRL